VVWRPEIVPLPRAWAVLAALTAGCTALAHMLLFRLTANLGASRT
jgi:drug/metabolite transporter (DMT)-like permease